MSIHIQGRYPQQTYRKPCAHNGHMFFSLDPFSFSSPPLQSQIQTPIGPGTPRPKKCPRVCTVREWSKKINEVNPVFQAKKDCILMLAWDVVRHARTPFQTFFLLRSLGRHQSFLFQNFPPGTDNHPFHGDLLSRLFHGLFQDHGKP